MGTLKRRQPVGLLCPADPEHGPLLEMPDGSLHCPSQKHHGRPASHPLGKAEASPSFFSLDQAEAARA